MTSAAIADTLRIATAGDYDQALAKLNLSQRQVPVVVKLSADARTDFTYVDDAVLKINGWLHRKRPAAVGAVGAAAAERPRV